MINDVHGKTTGSINLTGKTQYTVSYNKGSNGTGENTTANKVFGTNLTLLGETFTRTGYTQTAWNTDPDGTSGTSYDLNGTYSTDAALTLYPTWTVKNYTITYSPSTPSHCAYTATPANANYGSTVNLTITPDANYVISSVTAVDASSNPVSVTGTSPNYSFTMPASNVTVTVVTAPSAIAVNYGAGANGSLAAEQNSASIGSSGTTVNGGSRVNFTATPNTGYEVEGWYSSYSAGEFSGKINEAGTSTTYNAVANSTLNVYVKFKLSTYTITYENMTGATNHASNPANYNYESSAITLQTPTKEGYTFGGWFTNADLAAGHEAGTPAIPNHTTGNKTFYAKWTGYSYTVRFNANDGSGTMENETGFVYGTNKALTANAFTRAGYTFSGWATSANGEKVYNNSQSVSILPASNGATVDLYAVWTERPYKIVYFAKPADWDHVYAYAWSGGINNTWPGVQLDGSVAGTGTVTVNCATYYYYKFYTDAGSDDAVATVPAAVWPNVIFNSGVASGSAVANNTKTSDLTIVDGNYYGIHTGMQSTSASGYSSSAKWTLRGDFNSWDAATYPFSCADNSHTYSVSVTGLKASTSYDFKIYGPDQVAYKYTGGKDAAYYDKYDITSLLDGRDLILNEYQDNNNSFTAATTSYTFTIDVTDPKHPVLTVISGEEANYSATLQAGAHGSVTNAGAVTLHRYATTTITATPEPGYRFLNWTSTGGGTVEFGNANNATTTVTATAEGATITANFTNEGIIYLDKSAISSKWNGTPYVYFYSAEYWNNDAGSGSQMSSSDGVPGTCISASNAMTRIGESQIWYYDYSALLSARTSKQYIAFVDNSNQTGKNWFNACSVIYRGDFYPGASMFVVRDYTVYKNQYGNVKTAYYNEGYWRKYNDTDPGYVLKIYNGTGGGSTKIGYAKFASTEPGSNTCTAKVNLSIGEKGFKVEGCDTTTINGVGYAGTWYSNSGSMTSSNCSNWEFTTGVPNNCGITPTAEGDYIFTLSLADGRLYVSVEYPLANDDYRIVYNGKVKTTGSATHHPSNFIRNISNGGIGKDTVSFFVTGDWSLTLQKCTNASANPVVWANACDAGHTLTASDLGLSGKTGVYVFEIEQNNGGSCNGVTISKIGEYTGNYYIRTDVATGGWEAYETVPDNRMIFSEYARDHSGYDYYHCHWTPTDKNVKFTIANDYSPCITDTVENDTYVTNSGKLPYQASVRFMYNSATNSIGRAYLNGSSEEGVNTFLWLQGAAAGGSEPKIFKGNGSALTNDTIKMQDKNNWIYQLDIKANEQARVKLISNYHFNSTDHLQYFKGTDAAWSDASTAEILGGNYSSHPDVQHDLRIIYDFKTNRLLSAWLVPETGTVASAAINTDVMILKQNQDDARQITFSEGDGLTKVDTVYTAIQLDKAFLTGNGATVYEKQFYWVSFPYPVKLNDVFGSIGNYGADWIMQRYNGKKRAANGFWIDSEPNWEFMDRSETLNPYEGYILTLDLGEFTSGSLKWNNNVTYLTLYFPSDGAVGNIKQTDVSVKYKDQSDYVCTITRDNRNIKDSYWHCIGSPSFATSTKTGWNTHDGSDEQWTTENLPFLYEWDSETNVLSPITTDGYTFKPLTGYMVQYSGESIEWTSVVTPSASAPKRQNSAATDLTYKLQLVRGEEEVDHTFVRFSDDENITAAFEFNQDLCKEYKSGGNIYTITSDAIQVAGNSLPLSTTQTTIVPVGVTIKSAGDYTFAIPEGTEGIGVTLVDNETGTRTSLSALDYTVTLQAGDYTGRFVLEISPIQNTPTGLEEPTSDSSLKGRAQKVMIDGILYIVKDGKIFDARGTRVE